MLNKIGLVIVMVSAPLAYGEFPGKTSTQQMLSSGEYIVSSMVAPTAGVKAYEPDKSGKIRIGNFTPAIENINAIEHGNQRNPASIDFMCTAEQGLVGMSDHGHISAFIRSAFIAELDSLNIDSPESVVELNGKLVNLDLQYNQISSESMTSGTWGFELVLQSSTGKEKSFVVGHSYPILDTTNYCNEMTAQFVPSVQSLMLTIFNSEEFVDLLKS